MTPEIGSNLDAEDDPARLRAEVRRLRSALGRLYTGATGNAPHRGVTAEGVIRAVAAQRARLEEQLRLAHGAALVLGRLVSTAGTAVAQLRGLDPAPLWLADLRSAWDVARRRS